MTGLLFIQCYFVTVVVKYSDLLFIGIYCACALGVLFILSPSSFVHEIDLLPIVFLPSPLYCNLPVRIWHVNIRVGSKI